MRKPFKNEVTWLSCLTLILLIICVIMCRVTGYKFNQNNVMPEEVFQTETSSVHFPSQMLPVPLSSLAVCFLLSRVGIGLSTQLLIKC